MAFDGSVVYALCNEFNNELNGARMQKIAQPEPDEILLTLKTSDNIKRLLININASLPYIRLTDENKPSPMTAPGFCMLMRKYLGNSRLLSVSMPSLERVLVFTFEHRDEMGDLREIRLIAELMGKHSNLIVCDENNMILDSLKHVSKAVSSVREVLPGRTWFIPDTLSKADPFALSEKNFGDSNGFLSLFCENINIKKALYSRITGISPLIAEELLYAAKMDSDMPVSAFAKDDFQRLYDTFKKFISKLFLKEFSFLAYSENGIPKDFSVVPLSHLSNLDVKEYNGISEMLCDFYSSKDKAIRIRQKSSDLRHIVQTAYERTIRKLDAQLKQQSGTDGMEKYKLYGELLQTYGYDVPEGSNKATVNNYYTNEKICIPLDATMSAIKNAERYYNRYNKLKRTRQALITQIEATQNEAKYLESVLSSLDMAQSENELTQVRSELIETGFIRFRRGDSQRLRANTRPGSGAKSKSGSHAKTNAGAPAHYISRDGIDLYVGKNNIQNEELTLKIAARDDWWFHVKNAAGSHVIAKSGGKELPDTAFEDAARLAAYYSNQRGGDKIEVDYVQRKYIKKPPGSFPGFVIYHTNYSMIIDSDISKLKPV
ncbi:MAG: NFACT family protein [Lachnospiraceae bacterium]|jgi:predicted ribosome quality control (RQC) complex YloA/Tae2 family protein|nr:NFACT family protein [Lachnospiraceae bacterium]